MEQTFTDLIATVAETKGAAASNTIAMHAVVDRLNALIQNATDLAEAKTAAAAMTQDLKDNVIKPLSEAVASIPPA